MGYALAFLLCANESKHGRGVESATTHSAVIARPGGSLSRALVYPEVKVGSYDGTLRISWY